MVYESDKLVLSKNGKFIGQGYSCNGMIKLNLIKKSSLFIVDSINLWHARLGHVNYKSIKNMNKLGLIFDCDFGTTSKCEICVQAKIHQKSFKTVERKTGLLDLVYSDVGDLKSHITYGGNQYYITFTDDYTRYAYVYLMKTKDEAFDKFKIYKADVETQLGVKIKILHSDRGGEYFSNEFTLFCKQQGIIHQCTGPYTPQQNGAAERKIEL